MVNHILLGRGRSIFKKYINSALNYDQQTNKTGNGTAPVKKNYGGMMGNKYDDYLANVKMPSISGNKVFKPLKFKM